jgi:hypothetical protein
MSGYRRPAADQAPTDAKAAWPLSKFQQGAQGSVIQRLRQRDSA